MQNHKFVFVCLVSAVAANIAIIGCNRQGANDAKNDTVSVALAAPADTVAQPPGAPPVPPGFPGDASHNASAPASSAPQKNPYENAVIEIKTFKVDAPATGYGYDIILNGHSYIHQYNIPGVPGNNGFSTESNARKAGEFVANKIRHNIMPPAVDAKELDSLGVLK